MKPLKPVMAALLAAASASFATPGTAFAATPDAPTATEVDCLKALDVPETSPDNALTCLVQKKPEARKDIGERLASFIQGKEPGRQYLTNALLKDEKLLKLAVAEAKAWPEAMFKKDKAADAAVLYFVVGPETDAVPAWAQVKALQGKLKPKMKWSVRLAEALTAHHWSDTKRVSQQGAANGVNAFLNSAAALAHEVMKDQRTKKEIGESVTNNDTTAPSVPTVDAGVGGRVNRNRATFGAGFTRKELYEDGAVTGQPSGPKDDGWRDVSMKIYSVRRDDGSVQNMIGIVDNTHCQGVKGCEEGPFKPVFVPVTATGKQTVTLREGGLPWEVRVDGDQITFGRPDTKPGEGNPLVTSFTELYNKRAEQCRNAGTVRVPDPDGAEYYVISQANVVPGAPNKDARGDLLYFDKKVIDNPQSNPRLLRPTSLCSVRMVDQDGVTVPVTWKPDMGLMPDGFNADGSQKMSPFHMIFSAKEGMWKVVPGAGEVDPAKPKPAPAKTDKPDGTVTNPTGAPNPATGDPGTVPTDGATTLDQVVKMAKNGSPPWSDGDNAALNPETAEKVHIMTGQDKKGARVFGLFFDPSMGVPGNQFPFPAELGGQPVKMIRGAAGKYVVIVFPKQAQYWDLPSLVKYVTRKEGDKSQAPIFAYHWEPEPGIQGVDDFAVAMDMLKFYKKVDPNLETTVKANIKKFVPKGPYKISGNATTLAITFGQDGSGSAQVWPKAILNTAETGSNDGLTDQKGPGTVYTLAGGGTGPFQQKVVLDGDWTVEGGGKIDEAAGYALYVGHQPALNKAGVSTMYKRYAIMIRFKKNGNPVLSKLIPIFGEAGDPQFWPKPSGQELHITGYPDTELGDTSLLRMFNNSSAEDGAISAYRTPASPGNMKDPVRNCVGPVVWWGIQKQQALEHCQSDSKTP